MKSFKVRLLRQRRKDAKQQQNSVRGMFDLIIALASGILMGFTVAPVGAWPLAWIALAPLWVLTSEPAKQQIQSIRYSLAWGIGYHGLALSWITGIHPMTWMGVPWLASLAIALFCWTFITFWGAALVASWTAGMALANRIAKPSGWCRVLLGVALWCSLESLWSAGPLWWTSLSYTQSPHNLAILHLGQLSGPSTVTAAVVAVNGLIAEAWMDKAVVQGKFPSQTSRYKNTKTQRIREQTSSWCLGFLVAASGRYLCIATGLLVGLHLVGFGLYSRPLIQMPDAALKVGIIQGNVPNEIKLYPAGFRRAIGGYTTGYQALASQGVDAVLTPEGALPFLWREVMRSSFYSTVVEKGIVAWVGAFGEQESQRHAGMEFEATDVHSITNSLFTITGDGQTFSRYNKVKLVPLGEYIPFEQFLGKLIARLSPLNARMVAGQPSQLFDTPFGRAIASICYESAFAQHFRYQAAAGGEFILSAANNAHYSPAMPAQHHAQDVMRAIETDRWAVRATNTGYSGIVDPHGRTKWISQLNAYELHAATIYRRQTQVLYVRWGDWLTLFLLVLGGSVMLYRAYKRSRKVCRQSLPRK